MSTESPLTTELIETEKRLQQFSPQASTLDRDALMYQAGWSAAKLQATGKVHWFWPASTTALAATLLLILLSPPASPLQRAGDDQPDVASASTPQPTNHGALASKQTLDRPAPLPLKLYSSNAPLLVMRERALRQEFNHSAIDTNPDQTQIPSETTNGQLLEEYLPRPQGPSRRLRAWPHLMLGENS